LCLDHSGCGLAAPQVSIFERMVVLPMIRCKTGNQQFTTDNVVLVNPVIIRTGGEKRSRIEGCLSFPGKNKKVRRHKRIYVEAYDQDLEKHIYTFTGAAAQVVQHEIDHLDGVTIG